MIIETGDKRVVVDLSLIADIIKVKYDVLTTSKQRLGNTSIDLTSKSLIRSAISPIITGFLIPMLEKSLIKENLPYEKLARHADPLDWLVENFCYYLSNGFTHDKVSLVTIPLEGSDTEKIVGFKMSKPEMIIQE